MHCNSYLIILIYKLYLLIFNNNSIAVKRLIACVFCAYLLCIYKYKHMHE